MNRTNTRKIMVGNVQIGGENKVSIQSMCNTKTKDVQSTVKQILDLEKGEIIKKVPQESIVEVLKEEIIKMIQ